MCPNEGRFARGLVHGDKITVQIRKTYRGISPELLSDEIRDLLGEQEVVVGETESHTYALPSGMTQTRISFVCKTKGDPGEQHGVGRILALPDGETKLVLEADEVLIPEAKWSVFQQNLDFLFGSYEARR